MSDRRAVVTEATILEATPANMRKVEGTLHGVFCYSPGTGERYSATPGDYWNLPDDCAVCDHEGEPMILAVERCQILPVEL